MAIVTVGRSVRGDLVCGHRNGVGSQPTPLVGEASVFVFVTWGHKARWLHGLVFLKPDSTGSLALPLPLCSPPTPPLRLASVPSAFLQPPCQGPASLSSLWLRAGRLALPSRAHSSSSWAAARKILEN